MKYIVLLVIILGGIWLIRQHRRGSAQSDAPKTQIMIPCAHCGTHIPENEVIRGQQGAAYCSQAHRQRDEG